MGTENVNLVQTMLNPDAISQQLQLAQRQKMADMLMQQSMTPQPSGEMISDHYVPRSWTQGLAQMLQGYAANKMTTQNAKDAADIARQDRERLSSDLQAFTAEQDQAKRAAIAMQNPHLVAIGTKLLESLGSNDGFAKIDPQHYTRESITQFVKSHNPADLVPRDKIVADNLGGQTTYRTEYSPNPVGTANHSMTADTAGRLAWDQYLYNNPSALDRLKVGIEGANAANKGIETNFNTGQGITSPMNFMFPKATNMPVIPGQPPQPASPSAPASNNAMPVSAPRQANAAPAPQQPPAVAGLTPRQNADLAAEKAKAQQAAQAALPQTIATTNQAIQQVNELVSHPGLEKYVGSWNPTAGKIPGTDAADFKARLDQVLGGAFMQAYQNLKGGGQITEIEGAKATAAITRMEKAQSPKEFRQAASEFQGILYDAARRAQNTASGTNAAPALIAPAPSQSASGKIDGFKIISVRE